MLITSASKKVPLVQAVQQANVKLGNQGRIYGGDVNAQAIARHFVDAFWEMPRLSELQTDDLISYCREHNIRAIIPTRDGELGYFAERKRVLQDNGIAVMVSSADAVEICLDKLLFARRVRELGYPAIPAAESVEVVDGDLLVVKGRYGAGSRSIGLRLAPDAAAAHAHHVDSPIFQPFIEGREVSVDLYRDRKGVTKGVVVRGRDLVVDGESQVTSTLRHEEVEKICSELADALDLYGHIVFQVLLDPNGGAQIIECNSRFGGASTLSVAAGLDSFYWFLLEASGAELHDYPFLRSRKEKKQVRFASDLVI